MMTPIFYIFKNFVLIEKKYFYRFRKNSVDRILFELEKHEFLE